MSSKQTSGRPKLLLLEDDPSLAELIAKGLEESEYACQHVSSGRQALDVAREASFDTLLLDLDLRHESPLELMLQIKKLRSQAGVLLLTRIEQGEERLQGLQDGADDFLIKPFRMPELTARIDSLGIRKRTQAERQLEVGALRMDLHTRRVYLSDRSISLTPTEFRILEILVRNREQVVTRRMLCELLWDPDWEGVTNVIEVHINRLRSKLSQYDDSKLIHTVRGRGYCLREAVGQSFSLVHGVSSRVGGDRVPH